MQLAVAIDPHRSGQGGIVIVSSDIARNVAAIAEVLIVENPIDRP